MHARLKLATQLDHERVDRSLSTFDLTHADEYAVFLSLNAAVLGRLRPHWRNVDEGDFDSLVAALALDLATLGVDQPISVDPTPGLIDGLGLAYVVRGSRLGSKILRKRVGFGLPTAYLDLKPATPWQALLQQIEERVVADPDSEPMIIAGARTTFAVYEHSARTLGQAV